MTKILELKTIIDDLTGQLETNENFFIRNYGTEPGPHEIEFHYYPMEKPAARQSDSDGDVISQLQTERRKLPENATCNLCPDRIYPVKRFKIAGSMPLLVLHFNGAVSGKQFPVDRSNRFIFGMEENDLLFKRMLFKAELQMENIFFQEFPGCHFNAERSLPEDWNLRSGNCLELVSRTIKNHNIQLLILSGPSAIFLLGEEKARELAFSGAILPLDFENIKVPAVVMRSPAAIVALEKKRKGNSSCSNEKQQKKYEQLSKEENKIKSTMLSSIMAAKKKYIN